MAIDPCLRCKQPPSLCGCFPHLAQSHFPAAILPGGTTLYVVATGSRYSLTLEIDERTSARELRAAGPTINEWRDALARFQGPQMATGLGELLEWIDQSIQEKDLSYGQWAENYNSRVATLLRGYHEGVALDAFGNRAVKGVPGSVEGCRRHAFRLLADLGFKKLAAEKIVADALGRLGAGKKAFLRGQPVSRDHMIGVVKTWRRRKTRRR